MEVGKGLGPQEQESLGILRAALSNPHGTTSEKRERVLAAWTSLRSATKVPYQAKRKFKDNVKKNKHEGERRRKRKATENETPQSNYKEEESALLHVAARMGQEHRIRELVESGAKVTQKDSLGFTALQLASVYGHTEAVRVLLALGAGDRNRINRRNDTGNTALHLACIGRHEKVAALLRLYKADEYSANVYGQTPVSLGLRELEDSVCKSRRVEALQQEREWNQQSELLRVSGWDVPLDDGFGGALGHEDQKVKIEPESWSRWDLYQKAWRTFVNKFTVTLAEKGTSSEVLGSGVRDEIRFHDVPWPFNSAIEGNERLLLEELGASGSTFRALIQQERLRWHPDKFLQLFGRHLATTDREAVLSGVETVIQLLNGLVDSSGSRLGET